MADVGALNTLETLDADSQETSTSSNEKLATIPGVMYISTIPPGVKPLHLQQVFEKYGEVGRIFLQPDSKSTHSFIFSLEINTLSLPQQKDTSDVAKK